MLAIIPARGGSKGLPGKNIKHLNGKPLIAYTIEAAKASNQVSRIILSTDDKEIAKIGEEYGAEVPFMRPSSLAGDQAKSIDVYIFTLDWLEKNQSLSIDEFMVLQPTSPLRTGEDIDKAIDLYRKKKADSVVSYCLESHPIGWHKYIDPEGKLKTIFEEEKLRNRQDEIPTYYPNGAIFIFKKELIKTGRYYAKNSFAYIMPRERSVDIDTIEDFEYAEFLINKN